MRSGHHAIIHWLLAQLPGPGLFRNNVLADGTRSYVQVPAAYIKLDKQTPQQKLCYIFNIEDRSPKQSAKLLTGHHKQFAWGTAQICWHLLVLRDPFNLFASRLRWEGQARGLLSDSMVSLWKSHAREYLRQTKTFPHLRPINYNRWCSDQDYRQALMKELSLPFSDAGRNKVASEGLGSSFDRRRFDGQAQHMQVHARWHHFKASPTYRALFEDDELLQLTHEIFGIPAEIVDAGVIRCARLRALGLNASEGNKV